MKNQNQLALFDTLETHASPSTSFFLSKQKKEKIEYGKIIGQTSAKPLHFTQPTHRADLQPLFKGMELLRKSPYPQQANIGAIILANDGMQPDFHEIVISAPRRCGKTESIWATILGLCMAIPEFFVVTTAQTYIKARERFLSISRQLDRVNVGAYQIKRGTAAEAIEFHNGSRLWVVTPEGQAFRGDRADIIVIDEAQEHDDNATADILSGALALLDTSPWRQLIVAGTPGLYRSGMLWDYLERGHRGDIGICEYAVPPGIEAYRQDQQNPQKWHAIPDLIEAAHPGIGTLTTLDIVQERLDALKPERWSREYCCQWPEAKTLQAIDPECYAACKMENRPEKPARFVLCYDIAPDQSVASIVAVWRDAQNTPHAEVVANGEGDGWVAAKIHAITKAHPNTYVVYDRIGPNQAVADRLEREARPRPRMHSLGTGEITAAAAAMDLAIRERAIRFVADPAMDRAIEAAKWRQVGQSRAWDRRHSEDDISSLVAATNGLKGYDKLVHESDGQVRIHSRRR